MSRSPLRLAAGAAALAILFLSGRAAIQIYRAQRLVEAMVPESLSQATVFEPGDSNAWARLGAVLEQRGEDPEAAGRALERAVALNAYNVPALLDLALHCEFQGETDRAYRYLEAANRLSRSYASRWALANFYLREGQMDRFWTTIREAINLNRSDPTAAFELCWRATENPDEILTRAIPDDLSTNRQYFGYLTQRGEADAAAAVWKRLEDRLQPSDLELGLRYADVLLGKRRIDAALEVWNRLCAGKLLACEPLDPARGRVVSNRAFSIVPTSLGFDWHLEKSDGIDTEVVASGGEPTLMARFSGAHPEDAVLVWQWAPVEPRRTYRLTCRYLTQGLPLNTGLHWAVRDETQSARSLELASSEALRARNDDWGRSELTFQSGPATRLIRLEFGYRRAAGTTRSEGSIALREVDVLPAERQRARAPGAAEARP
jgi:hypothetical protein